MANRPDTTGVICAACGGPLAPPEGAVRVSCSYCGSVNDLASSGAVRVAKELERFGIRLPERPLTVDQIEADFAERATAER